MASLVRRLTWSNQQRPRLRSSDTRSAKEGILKKKGHVRRNWLSRYFKLTPSGLHYYKDKESASQNPTKPQGSVELFGCTVKEDLFQRHENVFTVWTADGKDYHMQAESKPEMLEWISAIQKASKEKLAERRLTSVPDETMNTPRSVANDRTRSQSTDFS